MKNRRDFMKVAGIGFLSMLFPKWEIGENEMELSDIWAKIANQGRLTPQELDFLKNSARETQLRNAFISSLTGSDNKPSLGFFKASGAEFTEMPLSFFHFKTLANQSSVNSDYEQIEFDSNATISKPSFFNWSAATPAKIFVPQDLTQRGCMAFGAVQFASNGTGRREVRVSLYDATDTRITGLVMAELAPLASNPTIVPFSSPFIFTSSTSYITIDTYQNSGGALDIESINVGIMLIK